MNAESKIEREGMEERVGRKGRKKGEEGEKKKRVIKPREGEG